MLAFHIGGEEAEYVRVSIREENGDGWFSAAVEVVVGGFRGSYSASFNSWAFSSFEAQLEKMHRDLSGSALFTSYEAQLELVLECDLKGHIRLRGEATDYAGTGNTLVFELEIDQTHVPGIINTLQAALKRYPARAV
ncbi:MULTISPECIES: WapI family immunity protein [Pseudomonas]|uniref:Uncharacterized protein n=1 Tax=Pseudomonas abyssi TaxID=170540 RepID=A0A395R4Y2_9PSED|nr:hypothetical protein [Halopseudomonas gallaeciensis]RGP55143.1 hypothetical protein ASB58_08675 [Halopseudomonas gallaeciensis]